MNSQPENQRGVSENASTPSTDGNVAPAETVALTRPPAESQSPVSAAVGPAESQTAATIDLPAGQSPSAEYGRPAKAKPRGSAMLRTRVGDYEIQKLQLAASAQFKDPAPPSQVRLASNWRSSKRSRAG